MTEKILCVDDDTNILEAYRRVLGKQFAIETALEGKSGLEAIHTRGPFAVVVSDLRMPGMDGIQFLAAVRECAPNSVRVMLTGRADLDAAIAAVNEGNIFQFLTKPCSPARLAKALEASLEQHRLITAERGLLKKTLTGSVQLLTEILSLVNPAAFSRASRIKHYVGHMATQLHLPNVWQFELAAMLSQIGCITLPPDTLDKVYAGQPLSDKEQEMFASHPTVGYTLLSKIPRLESVARMIKGQQQPFGDCTLTDDPKQKDTIALGAQMLKVALDFDQLVTHDTSPKVALAEMRRRQDNYLPSLLAALDNIEVDKADRTVRTVRVHELNTSMILDEDIRAGSGLLLVARGQKVTQAVLERLRSLTGIVGVVEPFRVLIPRQAPQQETAAN